LDVSPSFLTERIAPWFYFLPAVWMLLIVELYDTRRASSQKETIRGISLAAGLSLASYLLVFFISEPNSLPRRGVAIFIVAATISTLLWRLLYIRIFTAPESMRRVLIIGAGRAGTTLVKTLREIWPPPFYLVGYIDDDSKKVGKEIEGYPVLGGSQQLFDVIQEHRVTDLIVAISGELAPDLFRGLLSAEERGLDLRTMPSVYEDLLGRVPIFLLQSDWVIRSFADFTTTGGFYELMKRLIDLLVGIVGSFLLALMFPFVALCILLESGFPIIYSQVRIGKNGHLFKIYKFRTMRKDAEIDGQARLATENDDRVTRFGRFLRKSHLDEFPQFINVLTGELSMVGPRAERPELVEQMQESIPFYRARLMVKPGLTGWAQVNFGYAATMEDTAIKLEYDLYYIKHRNIMLDIMIILRTISQVIGLRGQ
jgi:exopolysaccharide biosynthesis polyprenyl glycosylphosphotransferase